MSVKLILTFKLNFESGFHFTGESHMPNVDKVLIKRGDYLLLPATTIKGVLRENAEKILRAMGLNICDGSSAETVCGKCVVCEIFGHPRKRAPLRFRDVIFTESESDIRMRVAISRHSKTSLKDHLFSMEVGWSKAGEEKITGIFPDKDSALKAAAIVWVATKFMFSIGADKSRGLGWINISDFLVKIEENLVPEFELQSYIDKMITEESHEV